MHEVTIIDYGMGNLLSVARVFEKCGVNVKLSGNAREIEKAERIVLPGVGAFCDGMAGLSERNVVDSIKNFVLTERPFLGICLGMQMMLNTSEEFGSHEGLGLIPGKVAPIPATGEDGTPHKIPHIGWNELVSRGGTSWDGTILTGISEGTAVYFVHSFAVVPSDERHRLADVLYNGRLISAAIRLGNTYGTQFHPEKSGEAGLEIVANFLKL